MPDLKNVVDSYLYKGVGFRLCKTLLDGECITHNHIVHESTDANGVFYQCFTMPFTRIRGYGGFFFELIERLSNNDTKRISSFDDETVLGLYESIEREIKMRDTSLIV
ncbi:MAG: hypothetical protein G01um101448_935 [Parcubacteria group bacterium Gr01-1014_48]|nr:MAG: hypothetical protein G01um101448_935 [Parcubacteria group bacterium Gr01-1014_48]